MRKLITLILTVLLVGLFAAVVFAAVEAGDDSTAPAGTTETATQSGVDVSGPCDEAEHANDPRCTGAAAPRRRADDDRDRGGDRAGRSGPGRADRSRLGGVDNSGPGSVNSGHDDHSDDRDERGNVESGDDRGHEDQSGDDQSDDQSGEDRSGNEGGDDHSGSGHHGGDDDNSGHGGDDD